MAAPLILLLADRLSLRGASTYTLRLAKHWPADEFRYKVVCPGAGLVSAEVRDELSVTESPHLLTPVLGCVARHWLRRDLQKDPPALIHIQSRSMLRLGSWLSRRLRCPFVFTMHDFLGKHERLPFSTTWGRRVIAVSESVRDALVQQSKIPASLIDVVRVGVDEFTDPLPPVLDPNRIPVIGTAGALETVKGLPFFLGAAKQVLSAGAAVEFVVAGSGPEEANLRRVVRDLSIVEHVTFVPNVPDLRHSLGVMDIFCLPSLRQGLGSLMLDAMAVGRPVIATSVDGVNSVIRDGETGLLVPPGNSRELANRMLELLQDPFKARRLADAGREMVRRDFSISRMLQQTIAIYRQAIGKPTE